VDRQQRELFNEFLRSNGFRLYLEGELESVRAWRRELVSNLALTLDERLGYQRAIAAVQAGITGAFDKVSLEMPPWLKKELDLNDD
jgi:hypothetical protein